MNYTIMSGCFEKGSSEEQAGYIGLFGPENIQYYFDLYFHWYNLVHEVGHCIVEKQGAVMSKVREEMYVNELAVGFYRAIGENEKLDSLKGKLEEIIGRMPAPMPEGEGFREFYERIWGTEQLNNVMIYGYFQLNSVLEAFRAARSFLDVMKEIGVEISEVGASADEGADTATSADAGAEASTGAGAEASTGAGANADMANLEICSENAQAFFAYALRRLGDFGIDLPQIRLELVDSPMIQCARSE